MLERLTPRMPNAVKATLDEYLKGTNHQNAAGDVIAIAAPHVSPFGGWQTYREAYSALGPDHRDRTFVVLGTSHYGHPDRFGLTRKPFGTPYGNATPDLRFIDELADQPAVLMEDYCHAVEHSIEFQVVFLQHLYGPDIRIVPILCGSFARSILNGGMPEDNEPVRRFLGKLGEMAAREGDSLTWILGIDMAHMGARYGDDLAAVANRGEMQEVEQRDRLRIERVLASDAEGFWEQREGSPGRPQMVREFAALYVPSSCARSKGYIARLRAMEHRRTKRRLLRSDVFYPLIAIGRKPSSNHAGCELRGPCA